MTARLSPRGEGFAEASGLAADELVWGEVFLFVLGVSSARACAIREQGNDMCRPDIWSHTSGKKSPVIFFFVKIGALGVGAPCFVNQRRLGEGWRKKHNNVDTLLIENGSECAESLP